MALNISGLSTPNSVLNQIPVKNRYSVLKNSQTNSTPRFSPDADVLNLSPEALLSGTSKESNSNSQKDLHQSVKSKDESDSNSTEKQLIKKLQAIDIHVKMHEQQHISAGGSYVRGGPTFQYEMGPDGKSYAVAGEVQLDVSPIPNNPQATIAKAQTIRQAALAPSDPSGADRSIAASASQMENKARMEFAKKTSGPDAQSPDNSESKKEKNRVHLYVKAYQNISKLWSDSSIFNRVA